VLAVGDPSNVVAGIRYRSCWTCLPKVDLADRLIVFGRPKHLLNIHLHSLFSNQGSLCADATVPPVDAIFTHAAWATMLIVPTRSNPMRRKSMQGTLLFALGILAAIASVVTGSIWVAAAAVVLLLTGVLLLYQVGKSLP